MVTKFRFCIILIFAFYFPESFSKNYYFDSSLGKNENNGFSPKNAWKSFDNLSKVKLVAGDKILLKAGQTFKGNIKLNNISGKPDMPILISTYGGTKATILSENSFAISADSCNYLTIRNVICKGSGRLSKNTESGIKIFNTNNLILDSLVTSGYLYSGLLIQSGSNIKVTHVHAFENGYCGINVTSATKSDNGQRILDVKNIYIGYCISENNPGCPAIKDNHSGNGILLGHASGALIEYCEAMNNGWDMPREGNGPVGIWSYMSDSVIIQYCYSHHNKTSPKGADGGGFDFDGGMTNSILQYNFSEYNEGAGYGMFQYAGADVWKDNIVRYNISFNDGVKNGRCGIFMWCDPKAIQMKNLYAYNNTIVNKFPYGVNFLPGTYYDFLFENNIFLITDTSKEFIGGDHASASFNNNLYWNTKYSDLKLEQPHLPSDSKAVVSNPMIQIPKSDTLLKSVLELNNFTFFKPETNSSSQNSGIKIQGDPNINFGQIHLQNKNIGAW